MQFFWKFGPNLVLMLSFVPNGPPGVISSRGGGSSPPQVWERNLTPVQIGLNDLPLHFFYPCNPTLQPAIPYPHFPIHHFPPSHPHPSLPKLELISVVYFTLSWRKSNKIHRLFFIRLTFYCFNLVILYSILNLKRNLDQYKYNSCSQPQKLVLLVI